MSQNAPAQTANPGERRGVPLRYQVFGVLIITQVLLLSLLSGIMWWRIAISFSRLESQFVTANVKQVISGIDNEMDNLRATTGDWAPWDNMYAFAQGKDPAFIETNLSQDVSQTLRLNLVATLDVQGNMLFSRCLDLEKKEETPLPESVAPYLKPGSPLLKHEGLKSDVSGVLVLPDLVVLISSRPIVTSLYEGPIMGTLVMARYLDPFEIVRVAGTTRIDFNVLRTDAGTIPEDLRHDIELLTRADPVLAIVKDYNNIYGLGLLSDLENRNSVVIQMELPRKVYYEGRKVFLQFILAFLAITVVATVAVLAFFDRRVLRRIGTLGNRVRAIGRAEDFSARVDLPGNDEIGLLADSFNRMMFHLEQAQAQVRSNEARMKAIVESAADGIILIDRQGVVLGFNHSAEGIFGHAAGEIIGRNITLLMPEPHDKHHDEYMKAYLETSQAQILGASREVLGKRRDGTVFPMMLAVSEVKEQGTSIFTGIVRDITEHKRAEELLRHAATHDGLTQLLNRKRFEERLGVNLHSCIRYGHSLSLVMCDLDEFKEINDQYGHPIGDEVLRRFSRIIREEIRADDFGGRFGGDEFCLCLSHTPAMHAVACVERIRNRLFMERFEMEDGKVCRASASFGVAEYRTTQTDIPSLFAAADRALYTAKKQGRNCIGVDDQ